MEQLNLAGVITRAVTDLKARFSVVGHKHAASDITSGELAIARGGTGATTAALARTNIDAAQSNGATGTLKAAEDDIDALESSLAYVESTTATANHAIGDYFMLGNVLMKATAAIATGETISASNATPATIQGQIDTIQDSVTGYSEGDFNNVTVNGFYSFANASANAPTNSETAFALLVFGNASTRIVQIAARVSTGELWSRFYNSGTWSTWSELMNEDSVSHFSYLPSSFLTATDLNTIKTSGIYRTATNCTNVPTGVTFELILEVIDMQNSQQYVLQRATRATTGEMWVRGSNMSTWSAWKKVTMS